MRVSAAQRWRRLLILLGVVLCLSGAVLYGLNDITTDYDRLLQQAEAHYQAQRYHEAIAASERVLQRAAALDIRLSTVLLRRLVRPNRMLLHIANSRYHLAVAELRRYQEAGRDSRATPRPSLETVQRLLTTARTAYGAVTQTDPRAYTAAQVNATRVAAWQLILAAFSEQTPGRRSLKQQASHTIRDAARTVDFAYQHKAYLSRQDYMTALLLLETLTSFSQEKPAPRLPVPPDASWPRHLGDLLLEDRPELSQDERERFRQFFFALPLEAKEPWAQMGQGSAGAGQRSTAH